MPREVVFVDDLCTVAYNLNSVNECMRYMPVLHNLVKCMPFVRQVDYGDGKLWIYAQRESFTASNKRAIQRFVDKAETMSITQSKHEAARLIRRQARRL